jgi:hypothetical protein
VSETFNQVEAERNRLLIARNELTAENIRLNSQLAEALAKIDSQSGLLEIRQKLIDVLEAADGQEPFGTVEDCLSISTDSSGKYRAQIIINGTVGKETPFTDNLKLFTRLPITSEREKELLDQVDLLEQDRASTVGIHRAKVAGLKAQLEAARIPEGWQPIETAPKNSEWILLGYYPDYMKGFCQGGHPLVAYWGSNETWCDSHGRSLNHSGVFSPTHWMHLPAAPKP